MYIILVNYIKPLSEIDALLAVHREFLDKAYQAGEFICSGPQVPRKGGVILAKSPNREALLQLLAQDPFHKAGVAQYEIIEFTPIEYCQEFAPLLASNQ